MKSDNRPVKGALARAAERWQRAFLVGGRAELPQLADLSTRRDTGARSARSMPNPFRPRRA